MPSSLSWSPRVCLTSLNGEHMPSLLACVSFLAFGLPFSCQKRNAESLRKWIGYFSLMQSLLEKRRRKKIFGRHWQVAIIPNLLLAQEELQRMGSEPEVLLLLDD